MPHLTQPVSEPSEPCYPGSMTFDLTAHQARVLAAARYYISRGWHIVPVTVTVPAHQPLRKKNPDFHFGWKEAPTTDPAQVEKWFSPEGFAARPYQGIAIATGRASNLVVVDVDNEMAWDYFLTDKGLPAPETFKVSSQSKKEQFYFPYPEALGDGHLGKVLLPKSIDEYNPEVGGLPDRPRGVDFLEQGSVVFAAPTIVWLVDEEGNYSPGGQYEILDPRDPTPLPEVILEEYLTHSRRPRAAGGVGTGPRTHAALGEDFNPEEVNLEAAERQREDILQWAKDEFEMLINDPGSYWDNGCVRCAGVLVRLSNNPVFDFSESDVYEFFAEYAPQDEGFGSRAHDRIIQSAYRMAGDEVIEFDAETYDIEPAVAEALQKAIRNFANNKGQEEYTERREEAIREGANPETIPEKRASSALLPNLPDSFWNARPFLSQLRRKAWERYQSPDAVLHSFLAGYASEVDYQYEVDTGIGKPVQICYFAALVAPSGAGKGGSMGIGLDLAQVQIHRAPLGTGEGVAQHFLESKVDEDNPDNWKQNPKTGEQELIGNPTKKQVQVRHNMLIADSEASVMDTLAERKGSTLIPTLLKASMGEDLGNTNATAEANRFVPGGSYSMGAVIGIQVETAINLMNQTGSGFAQRWKWCSLTDPAMPRHTDPTPPLSFSRPLPANGEERINIGVDPEIREALKMDRYLRGTGQVEIDPFDSHQPVKMIQAAALLRLIDGPNAANRTAYMITQDDWELAKVMYDTSREVRIELQKRIQEIEMRKASAEGARIARVQSAREDQTKNVTVEKYRQTVLDAIRALQALEKSTKISYIQQRWSSKNTKQKIAEIVLPAMVEDGTLELNEGNYIIVEDKK